MKTPLSGPDRLIATLDRGLKILLAPPPATRPTPRPPASTDAPREPLSGEQRKLSGALMRVNHVGEVCAQALYQSQALFTRTPELHAHFEQAAHEEIDHLAWTRERLDQLGDRPSLLTPLWYTGAFAFGSLAGLAGDRLSLGFVVETERQVEQHLASHLDRLPPNDADSRAVVAQMKDEEARHADEAQAAGAAPLPAPLRGLMRMAARVMTHTAHYI